MRANGSIMYAMAKESRSGLMVAVMKDSGEKARLMDKENCIMRMATFMKETGLTIKPMAMELTLMRMEPSTSEAGKMTSSMASVWKHGLTEQSMKDSTSRARRTVKASLRLPMGQSTQESFK